MVADSEFHDILIIGAGLSGINAAHILREELPNRTFTIVEARSVIGGTWSFFRYPGFRSDSSMTTFGLDWFPWKEDHLMGQGHEITKYLEEAATQDGTMKQIRFCHKVLDCSWSSEEGVWTLLMDADGERKTFKANFVLACTGYYSYDKAMEATIPGIDYFAGQVVHPQWWPEDMDYTNKRVVVVGSGATAVTIIPSLAEKAAQVTMLQRSPSYVASQPTHSLVRKMLRLMLPERWSHWICWWKDVLFEFTISQMMLNFPSVGKFILDLGLKQELPKHISADPHFQPRYNPFEQRLCLCPDGDFFKALGQGNCDVVTDTIDTVNADGILLKSGQKLPADIIVTATGLYFQTLGGMHPQVDGQAITPGNRYTWRGCMLEDLPNMGFVMGYVTTSWTPGATLMTKTLVRVIKEMEKTGATAVVPELERYSGMPEKLAVDATSNYFVKATDRIPKTTGKGAWYGRVSLWVDASALIFGNFKQGLKFVGGGESKKNL
ncbi:hypothetical protein K4F52_007817 [Lecanicillium sp. MT-2017a]|nr:hypothetical protein K4F52_007817 [Lecanicillium sp. MT-2017a]